MRVKENSHLFLATSWAAHPPLIALFGIFACICKHKDSYRIGGGSSVCFRISLLRHWEDLAVALLTIQEQEKLMDIICVAESYNDIFKKQITGLL